MGPFNKSIISLLGIILLVGTISFGISYFGTYNVTLNNIAESSFKLFHIGVLLMLIGNGKIIGTAYWYILLFCLVLILFGTQLRIMHWPGASLCLLTGSVGVVLTYSIYFFFKTTKGRLDVLKLIWVVVTLTCLYLIFIRVFRYNHLIISTFILWVIFIDFSLQELKGENT